MLEGGNSSYSRQVKENILQKSSTKTMKITMIISELT